MRPNILGFWFAALSIGCGISGLIEPEERLTAQADWRRWYTAMEACVGRPGNFDLIQWWDTDSVGHSGNVIAVAEWRPPHTIIVVDRFRDDSLVITHEEIHDLLQGGAETNPVFARCSLESTPAGRHGIID
jgi:hypothetical protein